MKVRFALALLFLLPVSALPRVDASADRSADTAVLKNLVCEAGRAYARRDLAALERLTADDYRQTEVRGTLLHRAEWLEFVKSRKSEIAAIDCDDVEVQFLGDVAVVTGHWTYVREEGGQRVPHHQSRWTSVWTRASDGWKRRIFQNTYVNKNADRCPTEPAK